MSQDDWLLMHRVADGDEGAVAELYDRFGSLVFKVARQLLPSRAEAEDAVQEVFIRLWQTADRYDPRRAKLVTWVMLIARRHLIDRLRRSAVRGTPGTLQPDAPDMRYSLAVILSQAGKQQDAIMQYQEILRHHREY